MKEPLQSNPTDLNGLEKIIELSIQISHQRGRGGALDSRETAIKKLIVGDPTKKAGDRGEIDEIIEELQKEEIDPISLAGEIADFIYYRSKITDFPNDLEEGLVSACGFDKESARRLAVVKYAARVEASERGLSNEDRKIYERSMIGNLLYSKPDLFNSDSLNINTALDRISDIKRIYQPS